MSLANDMCGDWFYQILSQTFAPFLACKHRASVSLRDTVIRKTPAMYSDLVD